MLTKDDPREIAIFSTPVVQATCHGVPVATYGYTHILTESPDLLDDATLQVGNTAPCVKVHPKKSWEISNNRLGATTPRMPRTAANDYLPLEAIHLIDGDPDTCWCSHTLPRADVEPVWIRLDLPVEREITRIVLRKRRPGAPRNQMGSMRLDPGAVEVGMAMPAQLEFRLSRDGQHWETLFAGPSDDTPERRDFTLEFPAVRAKQIWIIGNNLPRVENWLFSFSISEVEVYDAAGRDLALVTRGTGVTVSSTQHSMGQTRDEHRWLWPIHTDLGLKWARVGYHDDPINWHWVEKERGVLAVDAEADAAITYLVERGVDVVMALGFGNRLYQPDPARKLPQLWEWYYENPRPPSTPEGLEAWARFIRYMARHFRDRVHVFELWNEWNIDIYWGEKESLELYLTLARIALPILREECPDAKIMLGSYAGFTHGISGWTAEEWAAQERDSFFLGAIRALAPEVDLIGWHPFYQTDPDTPRFRNYIADVRRFKTYCAAQGFHGDYSASEWTASATYPPPTPPNWWGDFESSELEKAKVVAQLTVTHTAMAVDSFFCETWSNYYPLDLTLLRRSFTADPISPQQPQAAYYTMRNLATALEDLQPAEFPVRIAGGPAEIITFMLARDGERVLTLWQPGRPHDDCPGTPCDILLEGRFTTARVEDPLNGTAQALNLIVEDQTTRIPGVLVKDYPILIRLAEPEG